MFVCDFSVEDQLLGVIFQCFSRVLEFTEVYLLAVYEFTFLCNELDCPFESLLFASYRSKLSLLCTCKVCRNKT